MRYRTDRLCFEWRELIDRDSLLLPVAATYDAVLQQIAGVDGEVTCILRTEQEQRDICEHMGMAYYQSVHMYWRGLDFSIQGVREEQVREVIGAVNLAFRYGGRFAVASLHVGTGPHVHLQVPVGSTWAALT